jgi:hypothetical protein
MPHLVWDAKLAASYERGGWTVTEIRPGVWQVVNPRERVAEVKAAGKGRGR